jgi:hypothetical protein
MVNLETSRPCPGTGSGLLEGAAPRGAGRRASIYGLIACQGDSLTFGRATRTA